MFSFVSLTIIYCSNIKKNVWHLRRRLKCNLKGAPYMHGIELHLQEFPIVKPPIGNGIKKLTAGLYEEYHHFPSKFPNTENGV